MIIIAQKLHNICRFTAQAIHKTDHISAPGVRATFFHHHHHHHPQQQQEQQEGNEEEKDGVTCQKWRGDGCSVRTAAIARYKRAEAAYRSGRLMKALRLLDGIHETQAWALSIAFVQLLAYCGSIKALRDGRVIHDYVRRYGFESDIFVANTLVSMYSKCGSLLDAWRVFDRIAQKDAVSWNVMITGHAKHGNAEDALQFYQEMKLQRFKPNKITFVCVVNACARILAIEHGKRIHTDIAEAGLESDLIVGSALVDMYTKCGCLAYACSVFDQMPKRNVISWTSLIGGYVKHGRSQQALKLFRKMKEERISPNDVTYICILNACANLANIAYGKQIHSEIITAGYGSETTVGNALIDMYVKCANLSNAQDVFSGIPQRDAISWSAMIAGHFTLGSQHEALQLFRQMQKGNVKPDEVTFVNLLSVCSHRGLLKEALELFQSMTKDYGLSPRLEHYGCLVDLFGRAGRLDEAETFIQEMPIQPDASVWMALLGACKDLGNLELAEKVSRYILKLDPQNEGVYVVLSNLYAAAGNWDAKMGVRKLMEERGVSKEPGRCWI